MDVQRPVYLGIDIGTTKVCTIVAARNSEGNYELKSLGFAKSRGLRKGVVVHIDKTVAAIRESLQKAKDRYPFVCKQVDISIAGGHIRCFNKKISLPLKYGEVTDEDLRLIENIAKNIHVEEGRQIIQVLLQEYKIDHCGHIKNPLGINGRWIECDAHIVTGDVFSIKNLLKCVQSVGLSVDEIILQPMASSESVLSSTHKERGVLLIDIGGGTSDIAVWKDGVLKCSAVIPVGGNHFTKDLAFTLKIDEMDAEKIKIKYGQVLETQLHERHPSQKLISTVLRLRAEELFEMTKKLLHAYEIESDAYSEIILTGGGALLKSLPILAEFVLEKPCKMGMPILTTLDQTPTYPQYSTVLGLLALASQRNKRENSREKRGFSVEKIGFSIKQVLKEIF